MKVNKLLTLLTAFVLIGALGLNYAGVGVGDVEEIAEANLIYAIIGITVGVAVAVELIPDIASDVATLESDANLDSGEQNISGVITLIVIVGVVLAIVGYML